MRLFRKKMIKHLKPYPKWKIKLHRLIDVFKKKKKKVLLRPGYIYAPCNNIDEINEIYKQYRRVENL